jgi:MurNAc alpha-1-phosphate uridylyltransferase
MALQCVILAGGKGTRMWPLTEELPKALLPVRGQPFAHRQLELLSRQGVTDVVYSIGHRGQMIREAVDDGARFGLRVRYVDEGEALRGTGGALRLCLDEGTLAEAFLVLYGDSYLPIELAPVVGDFEAAGSQALMTVLRNEGRWDRSNVIFQGGRVVLYDKKRQDPRMLHIDYGLTMLSRAVADRLPPGVSDLADLYHDLSRQAALAGHEVTRRFYEIGSPQGLRDLEQLLADEETR